MSLKADTRQPIPIGESDFRTLREQRQRYVDKTLFIRDVITSSSKVLLLPRPRRFGKTLNLSMLRYFFEKQGEGCAHLFDGLNIRQHDIFQEHHGQYPVMYLTFKDVKGSNWKHVYAGLCSLISKEIYRHREILDWDEMPDIFRETLEALMNKRASERDYEESLQLLCEWLSRYYQGKVVILIDEYDAPILSGYANGYYDEVVSFMQNFLSGGLKDNPYLFKGVLTGILRIARESIFSGLNNPGVYTVLDQEFNEHFGFTEEEVAALLKDYNLTDRSEEVACWYNGYLFGGKVVYNPWSVLNYVAGKSHEPRLYWSNTGNPAVIEVTVTRGGNELRGELEALIAGHVIEKPIYDNIIVRNLDTQDDLVWSLLLFSGYLKPVEEVAFARYRLQIPNREVLMIFHQLVQTWFAKRVESNLLEEMLEALQAGNVTGFERLLRRVVLQIISYHDLSGEPEKVYHALVLGMLVWLAHKYEIRSNRESGYGRYDLMLKPNDLGQRGILIEFKQVYDNEKPEDILKDALKQIEQKNYTAELEAAGIQQILKLAIAFKGKELWVKEG